MECYSGAAEVRSPPPGLFSFTLPTLGCLPFFNPVLLSYRPCSLVKSTSSSVWPPPVH